MIRIAWQSRSTGYKGAGEWHEDDQRRTLEHWIKVMRDKWPDIIHSIESDIVDQKID